MEVDIKCKDCKRWLGKTDNTLIAVIKCSNSKCKKDNYVKIVRSSSSTEEQIDYMFKKNNTNSTD